MPVTTDTSGLPVWMKRWTSSSNRMCAPFYVVGTAAVRGRPSRTTMLGSAGPGGDGELPTQP